MNGPTLTHTQKWWLGGLSAAAAILLVVVAAIVLTDDDGTADVAADTTTTTAESTTTTSTTEAPTTTAPFTPTVDPFGVAYPSPTTSQRFESPESAATSYATEVLGFTRLVVGEFRAGDSRSGEMPITDRDGGQETTVLVRQMEDDTWYVLGSQAPDIAVDAPDAGAGISSPLATSGEALAFEGTVNVFVRTQDDPAVLGEGIVMGAGTPPAAPFEGTIEFTAPTSDTPGIVVYRTLSAEDGHVLQATSLRVKLLAE